MSGTIVDLNETVVFARVVQAGSFSAAARQLDMPKSTVSRKVSELEERLGARLIQRTTRKLSLTDAGRTYFERSVRIVSELEEAEQAVGRLQAKPRGLLRVTAPLSFTMLGPIVAEYLERHAEVQVQLNCTDRQVDLVEERYDLAIRASQVADSTLIARRLGSIQRVLVAAPGYCKRRGRPRRPADLARHDCLAFGAVATPNLWTLLRGDEKVEVRVVPRFSVNDPDILAHAARAGLGIAWMPALSVAADLRAGRLRHVLTDWHSAEVPVHLLYPTARQLSPKVSAFVELAQRKLRFA